MSVLRVALNRIVLALVCSTWTGFAASQSTPELVAAYYDSIILSGKLQGDIKDHFIVSMKCARFKKGAGQAVAPPPYIGTDGYNPKCVVESIALKLNGKSVVFPAGSYADLADAHVASTLYLTTRGQTVVLHVKGGDGVASYAARFFVERQRLVAREIERVNAKEEIEISKKTF